jgi:hypothetical protein
MIGAQPAVQAPGREWACGCGQRYLVTGTESELRLWPRAGNAGYNRHGLGIDCSCIRCGTRLTLQLVSSGG